MFSCRVSHVAWPVFCAPGATDNSVPLPSFAPLLCARLRLPNFRLLFVLRSRNLSAEFAGFCLAPANLSSIPPLSGSSPQAKQTGSFRFSGDYPAQPFLSAVLALVSGHPRTCRSRERTADRLLRSQAHGSRDEDPPWRTQRYT